MKTIITLIAFMVSGMLLSYASANDESVLVVHADTVTDPIVVTPAPTATPIPTPTPTPIVEVVDVDGNVFYVTPIVVEGVDVQGTQIDDVGVYLTSPDSNLTIKKENNTRIILFPESLFSNSPDVEQDGVAISTSHLIDGKVFVSVPVSCSSGEYRLVTPLATIIVPLDCSNHRADGSSNFEAEYEQDELNGQLKVTAISGNIRVIDRNGETTNLTAGQDHTIGNLVSRVSWVLPVDGDRLYGGEKNVLAWTEYDEAIGYVLEYNLPGPVFAEENSQSVEFTNTQVVILPAGSTTATGAAYPFTYVEPVENVIIMEIDLGEPNEPTIVEARIFPIDADGKFLSGSESSDRFTVTWK